MFERTIKHRLVLVIAFVLDVGMKMDEFGQKESIGRFGRPFFKILLVCFKNKRNEDPTRFEHDFRHRYRRRRRNKLLY